MNIATLVQQIHERITGALQERTIGRSHVGGFRIYAVYGSFDYSPPDKINLRINEYHLRLDLEEDIPGIEICGSDAFVDISFYPTEEICRELYSKLDIRVFPAGDKNTLARIFLLREDDGKYKFDSETPFGEPIKEVPEETLHWVYEQLTTPDT